MASKLNLIFNNKQCEVLIEAAISQGYMKEGANDDELTGDIIKSLLRNAYGIPENLKSGRKRKKKSTE